MRRGAPSGLTVSDAWIQLIPTEPSYVPDEHAVRRLLELVPDLAPGAERVDVIDEGKVVFVDAGENFESANCNLCGAIVDLGWWADQVTSADTGGFEDLSIAMPCCGAVTSLNDLHYDWPQGFARWRLEIMNAKVGTLPPEVETALAVALGHPARVIYTHV